MAVFAALMLLPASSTEAQEYFTVQTGSYKTVQAAEKNFFDLEQTLPEEALGFLRIEKIQNFNTLRIGRFADRAAALELLAMVRTQYPASRVLSAFVKPERILKMHGTPAPLSAVLPPVVSEPVRPAVAKPGPLASVQQERRLDAEQEYYTLQLGSFRTRERAEKGYGDYARKLAGQDLDSLRIEKLNQIYTLRLGRFASRAEAVRLVAATPELAGAVILQAYIKADRIVKIHGEPPKAGGTQISGVPLQVIQSEEKKSGPALSETLIQAEEKIAGIAETSPERPAEEVPVTSGLVQPAVGKSGQPAEMVGSDKGSLDDQEYYTLQLGSFRTRERAEKGYGDYVRKLAGQDLDFLRIERLKQIYTLRLGRFASRAEAVRLVAATPELAGAVILQAYIKEERIVKMADNLPEAVAAGMPGVPAEALEPEKITPVQEPSGLSGQPEVKPAGIAEPPAVRDSAALESSRPALVDATLVNAAIVDEGTVSEPGIAASLEPLIPAGREKTEDKPEYKDEAAVVSGTVRRSGAEPEQVPGKTVESAGQSVSETEDTEAEESGEAVPVAAEAQGPGLLELGDSQGQEGLPETAEEDIEEEELPFDIFEEEDKTPKGLVPAKTVAVLTVDDSGERIGFPGRVFYDAAMEEVYLIVGKGHGSVLVFGPDYFPYSSLGQGRGVDSPRTLVMTDDGRLLVGQGGTETSKPRLTILNAAFFMDRELILKDIEGAENFVPEQMALGRDGTVYLIGLEFPGVMVLDRAGRFKHWWRPVDPDYAANTKEGFAPGTIKFRDVETDSKGRIYLLGEDNSRVYVFNSQEELLYSFGKKGGSSGKLSRPRALALDELRKCIYVVDYMRHTILVYRMDGEFIFEFGGYGSAPGWFQYPVDVVVGRNGHVIVSDLFNHRLQVFEVR